MSDVSPARTVCLPVCLRWLSGVAFLAGASAVAWAIVVYTSAPWAASYVMAPAIGWTLYRFARANTAGVVLWCLAVALVTTARWALPRSETDGLAALFGLTGLSLFVGSSIAFLVAAWRDRPRRVWNSACCNLALFTWIALLAGSATISSYMRHQDAVERTTETIIALHKLAAEVESIRARLGRLPSDEEEFVALRQMPQPTSSKHFPISYQRLDQDQYCLTCSPSDFWDRHWDLFGWIVRYNGPHAPRRMQVVLF